MIYFQEVLVVPEALEVVVDQVSDYVTIIPISEVYIFGLRSKQCVLFSEDCVGRYF